jgi:hypothetical protein
MTRDNSPRGYPRAAEEIAGDLEQDIKSIRDYQEDSLDFYRAMQLRAMTYEHEIRHYFHDRLFPEGAYAPTTPAEIGKGEWKAIVRRACIQMDLLTMAITLFGLAVDGQIKFLRNG